MAALPRSELDFALLTFSLSKFYHLTNTYTLYTRDGGWLGVNGSGYDQSRIFDIRPKPKTLIQKIRPSAEGLSLSQSYGFAVSRTGTEGSTEH